MARVINDMEAVVRTILFRNGMLVKRVSALEEEVVKLREELSRYKISLKDSHNNNILPSGENLQSQSVRRTSSLHTTSVRPCYDQAGHKGSILFMSDAPDEIQTHIPDYCSRCGLYRNKPGNRLQYPQPYA